MTEANNRPLSALQPAGWAPFRLRLLASCAVVALVSGMVAAFVVDEIDDWLAIAVFAGLFIGAENRDRVFIDETSLSGSIAVALAACLFFAASDSLFGPFLICATGGLYVPHLRQRAFTKVVLNACCFAVSALAATGIASLAMDATRSTESLVVAAVAATGAYWISNTCLLGVAVAWLTHRRFRDEATALLCSDTVMLVFGLGGALCGIVMVEVGVWVGFATLVALLVGLDVFVLSVPAGLVGLRAAWVMLVTRGVSGGVAGTVSAVVTRAVSVSVLGAIAGLAAGIVAGAAVVAICVAIRLYLRFGRTDVASIGGVVLVELVVPCIAATAGAVTAAASLEAGLFVASGLVVAVSVFVAVRRHRVSVRPRVEDEDVLMAAVLEAMMEGLPARER